MRLDLLIKDARRRAWPEEQVDIGIARGRVERIEPRLEEQADRVVDAGGNLVIESFVNAHLHLDKVFTLGMLDDRAMKDYHGEEMGKAMSAIEQAAKVKENYDRGWILENVRRAVHWASKHGCTHIRAFADVDRRAKLEGVAALLEAKREFEGVVALQVAAFPQDGVVREPGAAELVREALEMGTDVVGGIPWIEYTQADAQRHIDAMFELAVEFDRDVSMLVDDAGDPGLRTLEQMALKTLETRWQGRVLAHHARAMALYPRPYFQKLSALLRQAEIPVVSDPHTGPLHAPVRELQAEGVLVCLGQDDISDAYYPYGQNNMLEVAFLNSHMLWMTAREEMGNLIDMVTVFAAQAIGVSDHRLEVGSPANLVVLEGENLLEALRLHAAPRAVISHGKLVHIRQ